MPNKSSQRTKLAPVQVSSLLGVLGSIRLGITADPSPTPTKARALSPLEALERVLGAPNPDRQTITYLLDRLRLDLEEFDREAAKLLSSWIQVNSRPKIARTRDVGSMTSHS